MGLEMNRKQRLPTQSKSFEGSKLLFPKKKLKNHKQNKKVNWAWAAFVWLSDHLFIFRGSVQFFWFFRIGVAFYSESCGEWGDTFVFRYRDTPIQYLRARE